MMQKNPIQAELPSVPRAAEKGKRPRRGVLATLFIVAATLVIGFAWLALPQQRHPADTVTGKKIIATATPAVQPSPTVLSTGIYNYSSTYQIIVSVAWSPDSKRIALVDDTVKTWDFSTGGKGVVTYPGQTPGDNVAVAWSPDGRYLVGSGTKAQLWDADSGEAIGSYTPQVQAGQTASPENGHVIDSAWSPDGRLVASAADGQAYGFTVQVWNPQTLQTVFTIPTSPASYIRHVRWSPDGKYLAFDTNGNVLVYSVETRKLVSQNVGTIFAWSPDGKRIISVDDMAGNMLTWDSTTGQIVNTIHYQDPSPSHGIRGADSLAWSPDGTQVALATGSLSIWDVRAGKEVAVYTDPKFNGGNGITSLAWSPDGQKLASASGGEMGPGEVKVWQLK